MLIVVSWFSAIIPGFHRVKQNVKHCKFHMNMRELDVAEAIHDVSLAYGRCSIGDIILFLACSFCKNI
jgi:hypothetical protein